MTKKIFLNEVQAIIEEGASIYEFVPEKIKIIWIDEINNYVFVSKDNNIYGELSSLQRERYEKVLLIQNTFTSLKGDVENLDFIIREMQNNNEEKVLKK